MAWEDCWDILNIEPYSDKRTIKIAYAKQLKKTRPDENPEGFKALHDAYKEALDDITEHVEETAPQWFVPPDTRQTATIQPPQIFQGEHYHDSDSKAADLEAFLNGGNEGSERDTIEPPETPHHKQDSLPTKPYTTPPQDPNSLNQDKEQFTEEHALLMTEPHTTPLPEIASPQTSDKTNPNDELLLTAPYTTPPQDPNSLNQNKEQFTEEHALLMTEPHTTPQPEIVSPQTSDKTNPNDEILLTTAYTTPLPESVPHQSQNDLIYNKEQLSEADNYDPNQEAGRLEKDWLGFLEELETLLNTKIKDNKIADWSFLKKIPSMVDLEFRSQASDEVFENIANINKLSLEKRVLLVKTPVLSYLNDFFQWDKKWQYYEEKFFDDLMLDAVYPYIHEKNSQGKIPKQKKEKRELFYYKRILAFLIDAGGIIAINAGLSKLLTMVGIETNVMQLLIIMASVYFLLIIPLLEASVWQSSIGKRIVGIQVVNKIGLRIPWYQSFWRSLISVMCIISFKIVVWINLVLSWTVGWGLLQDIISQSYIIEGRYDKEK